MGEKTDQIKGRTKEAVGDLTDDDELKGEGKADRLTGKVKEKAGDAKDKIGDAADKVKDAITRD